MSTPLVGPPVPLTLRDELFFVGTWAIAATARLVRRVPVERVQLACCAVILWVVGVNYRRIVARMS